jgi:hypothetical protein
MTLIGSRPSAKTSLALKLKRSSEDVNPTGTPTFVPEPDTKTKESLSHRADKYLTDEAKTPSFIVINNLLSIASISGNKKSG